MHLNCTFYLNTSSAPSSTLWYEKVENSQSSRAYWNKIQQRQRRTINAFGVREHNNWHKALWLFYYFYYPEICKLYFKNSVFSVTTKRKENITKTYLKLSSLLLSTKCSWFNFNGSMLRQLIYMTRLLDGVYLNSIDSKQDGLQISRIQPLRANFSQGTTTQPFPILVKLSIHSNI